MAFSAGHPKYTLGGTDTVEVSAVVAKGQGLEADPDNPGKARPWSAASVTRLGVAQIPGVPESANLADNFAPTRKHVSVQKAPLVVNMRFTAATTWRQAVVAAAAGAVAPAAPGVEHAQVVGYCAKSDGVAANGVGPVELI